MNRVVLMFFPLLIFSCNNNDEAKSDHEVEKRILFEGISKTDLNGYVISWDESDWRLDDVWVEEESALFSDRGTDCISSTNSSYRIIAFPNPCSDDLRLHLEKPTQSLFSYRIVDQDFNVLVTEDSLMDSSIRIRITDYTFASAIYRVYYKFLEDGCEYRGHGDIEVINF